MNIHGSLCKNEKWEKSSARRKVFRKQQEKKANNNMRYDMIHLLCALRISLSPFYSFFFPTVFIYLVFRSFFPLSQSVIYFSIFHDVSGSYALSLRWANTCVYWIVLVGVALSFSCVLFFHSALFRIRFLPPLQIHTCGNYKWRGARVYIVSIQDFYIKLRVDSAHVQKEIPSFLAKLFATDFVRCVFLSFIQSHRLANHIESKMIIRRSCEFTRFFMEPLGVYKETFSRYIIFIMGFSRNIIFHLFQRKSHHQIYAYWHCEKLYILLLFLILYSKFFLFSNIKIRPAHHFNTQVVLSIDKRKEETETRFTGKIMVKSRKCIFRVEGLCATL